MAPSPDSAYHQVLARAFRIASATGELARPVHLLAALATTGGPISEALTPPGGGSLVGDVDDSADRGGGSSYLVMQTQGTARRLADERGEPTAPEHLLVAVIDQGDPEAMTLLTDAGIDIAGLRAVAVRPLGAPADLPPIQVPDPVPAGTMDRPPLPVEELNPSAWAVLVWRQRHLPLQRIRRQSHYGALCNLERREVSRIAHRLGLDEDQQCSLSRHHLDRVEQLVAQAHPDLVHARPVQGVSWDTNIPVARWVASPPHWRWRRWRRRWLGFTIGWGTWFSNRWVGLRYRWFRILTIPDYRGAPQP